MRLRRVCDEELAAACVSARQRHADRARLVSPQVDLVAYLITRPAILIAARVTRLHHEVRHDAHKLKPVVKAFARELYKIIYGHRRVARVKLDAYIALLRVNHGD